MNATKAMRELGVLFAGPIMLLIGSGRADILLRKKRHAVRNEIQTLFNERKQKVLKTDRLVHPITESLDLDALIRTIALFCVMQASIKISMRLPRLILPYYGAIFVTFTTGFIAGDILVVSKDLAWETFITLPREKRALEKLIQQTEAIKSTDAQNESEHNEPDHDPDHGFTTHRPV